MQTRCDWAAAAARLRGADNLTITRGMAGDHDLPQSPTDLLTLVSRLSGVEDPDRVSAEDLVTCTGRVIPLPEDPRFPHLRRLMDRLSGHERRVMELHIRGISQGEIADLLRMSQPTISYHYSEAIRHMRMLYEGGYLRYSREIVETAMIGAAERTYRPHIRVGLIDTMRRYWDDPNPTRIARACGLAQSTVQCRVVGFFRSCPVEAAPYLLLREVFSGAGTELVP